MSLAADIRERLATWTGSDAALALELGCARTRISSERHRAKVVRPMRECACRRMFRPLHGAKRCEDCRGDSRTWADRTARDPSLRARTQRCSSCALVGHNRRTCGRREAADRGGAVEALDGAKVEA